MSNPLLIGLAGNEISKKITGTSEVSVGRSIVATGAGVGMATVAVVVAGLVRLLLFHWRLQGELSPLLQVYLSNVMKIPCKHQ